MYRLLSILFLSAAIAAAQNESAITRDGAYWVRTIQGVIDMASSDKLRVETTGNVSMHGIATEQTTYTLTVRVRAGDAREAEALLDRVNVKTGTEGGWAFVKVTPPRLVSSGMDLTVSGSQGLRRVLAETRGGNVQASDWDGDFEGRSAGGRLCCGSHPGRQ